MPETPFDVVFSARLAVGADPAAVKARIQILFRLDEARAERLFSGRPITLKRGIGLDTAQRLQAVFREAGAIVEILPVGELETIVAAPPPPDAERRVPSGTRPARSDGAAGPLPRLGLHDRPASGALSLAPPGTPLDEIDDRGPPLTPDTSWLSMVAEAGWTLEDCAPAVEPAAVPDTSALTLAPMSDPVRRSGSGYDD